MRRPTYIDLRVLAHLRLQNRVSYDTLAAVVDADRSSIIISVRRLQLRGRLRRIETGRGRRPNAYQVLEG